MEGGDAREKVKVLGAWQGRWRLAWAQGILAEDCEQAGQVSAARVLDMGQGPGLSC